MWNAHVGTFFESSSIALMFELIDQMAPEYSRSAREYFDGDQHRGYNCYVLKKELFLRLCELQFPIMFEVKRRLDTTGYTQTMLRTPAFIGEMLYGIFIYHAMTYEHWRVKELQLVFFSNTERIRGWTDLLLCKIWYVIDKTLKVVADPLFPKGSRRREKIKDMLCRVLKLKKRGIANIK